MTTTTTATRYPIQVHLDGDFALTDILDAVPSDGRPPPAVPLAGVAEAAMRAQVWRPAGTEAVPASLTRGDGRGLATLVDEPVRACDLVLLHSVETSRLWRPPVGDAVAALTPELALAWLTLARHWVGVSNTHADLRFLNAACKLLGAVWTRRTTPDPKPGWWRNALTRRIGRVAQAIAHASEELTTQLAARLPPPPPNPALDLSEGPSPLHARTANGTSVVVLTEAGSASAARFGAMAADAGAPIRGVCWYGASEGAAVRSAYAAAWYPPGDAAPVSRTCMTVLPDVEQATARSWQEAAAVLTDWAPDLVVLLGMPIVPFDLVTLPRLGMINAHNGALPTYRGMDAVGWAVLNNDPIVCSVHQVTAGVDAGGVLTAQPVPFSPANTLRARVKGTQLRLLTAVTSHAIAADRLPDATTQDPALARQFYRLHPHLKRILDASPYGHQPECHGDIS